MNPSVSVIMGSESDWSTMQEACELLNEFEIPFEKRVISAHRTPQLLESYTQEAQNKEIKIIIAGAGGAAHLPGMIAAFTYLPVIGVPIASKHLNGLDSLLSINQMPKGVPVATMAIGGAANAAIFALRLLALDNKAYLDKIIDYNENQKKLVFKMDQTIKGA